MNGEDWVTAGIGAVIAYGVYLAIRPVRTTSTPPAVTPTSTITKSQSSTLTRTIRKTQTRTVPQTQIRTVVQTQTRTVPQTQIRTVVQTQTRTVPSTALQRQYQTAEVQIRTLSEALSAARTLSASLGKQLSQTQASDTATIAQLNRRIATLTQTASQCQRQLNQVQAQYRLLTQPPTVHVTVSPANPSAPLGSLAHVTITAVLVYQGTTTPVQLPSGSLTAWTLCDGFEPCLTTATSNTTVQWTVPLRPGYTYIPSVTARYVLPNGTYPTTQFRLPVVVS